MEDLISKQAAIVQLSHNKIGDDDCDVIIQNDIETIKALPSAQPQYEELAPEETALEIASGSIMSARYWFDIMIRLKQMGYAVCRKR